MAGRIRCFVGLPLPEAWRLALNRVTARLALRLASRIAWTGPDNWHLTLKFLGEVDEARLPEVAAALGSIDFAAPCLRLGRAGGFGPGAAPKTLWAGLELGEQACASLAGDVDRALALCGFAPERRPFRAHVTLGRVKAAAVGDDWAAPGEELVREVFAPARPGRLVLWRSILGPGGPKYVALKGFPARDHGGGPDWGAA